MVTTQDVNLLRSAQDETVKLAQAEFAKLWKQLDGLDPARKRDMLLDLIPALIRKWQDVGGTAAAEWYETVRRYYFDDTYSAVLPEPPNVDAYDDEIRKLVRWKAGLLWDTVEQPADPERFRTFLNNMVEHNIRDTGRQTIKENAGRDRDRDMPDDITGWPDDNPKVSIDLGDGDTYHGYLFNRSHLIAKSLGGEDIPANMITGTRTENVGRNQPAGGMAYAETLALDWLDRHPDGTVTYMATPDYTGDELLPRTVTVDIRTSDGTIDEHVTVYNTANGHDIDYAHGGVL